MSINPVNLNTTNLNSTTNNTQTSNDSDLLFENKSSKVSSSWTDFVKKANEDWDEYKKNQVEKQKQIDDYYQNLEKENQEYQKLKAERQKKWDEYYQSLLNAMPEFKKQQMVIPEVDMPERKKMDTSNVEIPKNKSTGSDPADIEKKQADLKAAEIPNNKTNNNESYEPTKKTIAKNEKATIWGDPHIIEADGGKYDFQGEAGKIYNILSDSNLEFNSKFKEYTNPGTTVMGQTGITVKGLDGTKSLISFNADSGTAFVDGSRLKDGQTVTLADGGAATLNGNKLTVETKEGYKITQTINDKDKVKHINSDIETSDKGVNSDGVMPTGLLGETFDEDKDIRTSTDKQWATGAYASDDKTQFNRYSLFDF